MLGVWRVFITYKIFYTVGVVKNLHFVELCIVSHNYIYIYIYIYLLHIKFSYLTNYNISKLKWIFKDYLICYKDEQNILNEEFSIFYQSDAWRYLSRNKIHPLSSLNLKEND